MPLLHAVRGPVALPAGVYVGPGDLSGLGTWVAWYGLRAFNAAYATGSNPALDLHKDSDGSFDTTINILSDGSLDVTTAAARIAAGASKIGRLYDQVGTRHLLQATAVNQPPLVLNVQGSLPAIQFDTNGAMETSGSVTQAQPFSISAVVRSPGTAGRYAFFGTAADAVFGAFRGSQLVISAGNEIGPTVTTDVFHRVQGVYDNNTPSDVYVDGGSNTGNALTNTIASALRFGWDSVGAVFSGYVGELGLWNGAFSAGNKSALDGNQATYWGL